jgi:hypothetical protein
MDSASTCRKHRTYWTYFGIVTIGVRYSVETTKSQLWEAGKSDYVVSLVVYPHRLRDVT